MKMLEKYFQEDSLNEETKLVIKEQWEQFNPDSGERPNLDEVFYRFYYSIDNFKKRNYQKPDFLLKVSKIAAILIVGILIAAGIYFSNLRIDQTANQQKIEIVSHDGFRSQFTLPDGTTGWLGYGSNLTYYMNRENQRIVDLDGLAFFDVAHQKKHPFIVRTPTKLDIEVVGTRFNVSAYSEGQDCDVVLEEGSVQLNLGKRKIQTMKPRERVVYHPADNSIKKFIIENVDDFLAWKDGKLVLRNITLKEACVKLSRFYNVDFELQATGLDDMEIQLTLVNEKLENALNLLTMISPVSYQVDKRKLADDQSYSKEKIIIKNK